MIEIIVVEQRSVLEKPIIFQKKVKSIEKIQSSKMQEHFYYRHEDLIKVFPWKEKVYTFPEFKNNSRFKKKWRFLEMTSINSIGLSLDQNTR